MFKRKEKLIDNIEIKYLSDKIDKMEFIEGDKSDRIDLRIAQGVVVNNDKESIKCGLEQMKPNQTIKYKAGDVVIVGLGFACKLPKGCEAEITPRSSMFMNYGLLLTNCVGVIDESYCGNTDEWKAVFYATRDGKIEINDRLLQFRIDDKMKRYNFVEVETLNNESRGGYGTSGTK